MLIPCLHLRSPRFLFLFLSAPLEELLMVLTLAKHKQQIRFLLLCSEFHALLSAMFVAGIVMGCCTP